MQDTLTLDGAIELIKRGRRVLWVVPCHEAFRHHVSQQHFRADMSIWYAQQKFVHNTGGRIHFIVPDDVPERIRGIEFDAWGLDPGTELSEDHLFVIQGRIRGRRGAL